MPLSHPAPREPVHTRAITLNGYARDDGLFDVEAYLSDTKPWAFENEDRGIIDPGTPLHGMWMRMTVDINLTIVACEAATDHSPYTLCPSAAPNFSRLAGLRIKPGFLKEANARVAGAAGCTHLRELLQQMATTAYQAVYPVRARQKAPPAREEPAETDRAARMLNTCVAYGADSLVVRRNWPDLYTGPTEHPAEPAPAK